MRAVVTGSDGFIGRNLVERLQFDGVEVFQYDIKSGKDILRGRRWPKVDVFYHLACLTQELCEEMPMRGNDVNIFGTIKIAEAALKQDARFVFTSSASVYGQATQLPTPVSAPMNHLTAYAQQKGTAEHCLTDFSVFKDLNYTIYRLSNVYGPYQTLENPYCGVVGRFMQQANQIKALTVIGDGTQTRDFTFVEDVVDILIQKELMGTFNVSSGYETSIYELAGVINHITGNNMGIERREPRSVDKISRRWLESDFWCPTPLESGLRNTYDWFLDESS